jgi:mono/diheme cytochrome c family protein
MSSASRVLIVLCLAAGAAPSAQAAGFGERFRDFIVGAEAPAARRAPGLDHGARSCLACHDGARATHIAVRAAGSPLEIRGSKTLNHPVGMPYDRSVMKDPQGYKPRAALPPAIRLVDGQVSCVSCHQTRTDLTLAATADARVELANPSVCTATKELTMGRRDRDLCLACHNK